MGEYTKCNDKNLKQRPRVGAKAGKQAGQKFFNNPELQQAFSKMSQSKVTLSPQEENQWTALQIYFCRYFQNIDLPSNINRAAMLRLKKMKILTEDSRLEANVPIAYFTGNGMKYVLNLVNDMQRHLQSLNNYLITPRQLFDIITDYNQRQQK